MSGKRKRVKIDPVKSATATFSSKKKILGELSNFYSTSVFVDHGSDGGVRGYLSGEAAFHGSKFRSAATAHSPGSSRGSELKAYAIKFEKDGDFEDLTAAQLKSKGGKSKKNGFQLDERELAMWSEKCIEVQRQICQYKFDNNEDVRATLISSGKKILVHSANRTSLAKVSECFWEGKAVLNQDETAVEVLGRNELGKIWMEIREGLFHTTTWS